MGSHDREYTLIVEDKFFSDLAEPVKESPPGLPYFTDIELTQMHRYCLKYHDLVRGGGTPTEDQDRQFMLYQKACYTEGVAYGRG